MPTVKVAVRNCTFCGKQFEGGRVCCSDKCMRGRHAERARLRNIASKRSSETSIHGDIALVYLGKGYVAVVDSADIPAISGKLWRPALSNRTVYAIHSFMDARGKSTRIGMHQVVLGKRTGLVIDHKDGDGLNNRRSNLRHCTDQNNQQNQHAVKGVSRFKGVYRNKRGMWCAHIRIDRKATWLGTFTVEKDAARAYDAAAREHFGEFAKCNLTCVSEDDEPVIEIVDGVSAA